MCLQKHNTSKSEQKSGRSFFAVHSTYYFYPHSNRQFISISSLAPNSTYACEYASFLGCELRTRRSIFCFSFARSLTHSLTRVAVNLPIPRYINILRSYFSSRPTCFCSLDSITVHQSVSYGLVCERDHLPVRSFVIANTQ